MFIEKEMFGIKQFNLNINNYYDTRIIIPNSFVTNEKDVLVLLYKEDYIEVWNRKHFDNQLKILESKLERSKTLEEKEKYRSLINQIYVVIVTGRRNVTIAQRGSYFRLQKKFVEHYHLENGGVMEGRGEYLRLWNQQKFETYKKQLGVIELSKLTVKAKTKRKIDDHKNT